MNKFIVIVFIVIMVGFTSCTKMTTKLKYPDTEKDLTVMDCYFGIEITDPYRWLENDTSKAVTDWVNAQNEVTTNYLNQIPFRKQLGERMKELVNYEKIGIPFKKYGKYYFEKNNGLQNQNVLYEKSTLEGEATVLLDPNTLSKDGTVAVDGKFFSHDGKYLAYTVSRSGSDWREIFVMDLKTKKLLKDHIQWAKFTAAAWCGDGFYYSAYDAPEVGKEFSNTNENHKIYYHKLGDLQSNDKLVYSNPKYPKRFYTASVNEDESFLFVYESGEGRGNSLYMQDLRNKKSSLIRIAEDFNYEYTPIEVIGDTLYIYTNYGAPKYRLMMVSAKNPQLLNWKELIPEGKSVLSDVNFIGGKIIVIYNQDASDHAFVYDIDGTLRHEVQLPTLGSVAFSGDKDDSETFYSFTSFTFPGTIYKYNLQNNTSEIYLKPNVQFTSDDYVTEQVFYTSKDGTKIPMFLTYKKGLVKNGNNPVFLYGYGGFNISLSPYFSTIRIPFLENGGIYAQMNLRGGGEYGEAWHIAGTKLNKQNVFDDCIAAAEYLIAQKYTSNRKIALVGGSNGGLLVGACINQRPDLFKVAIPEVGVMDMLRYHKFTIGWNWASDYGTSEESEEMFRYLLKYSPLHNIKNDGTEYPAVLVTTADHDDRVVPAHSFKYIAALQAANTGDAPKLIRIETKAGHGAGKPIDKVIAEQADIYSFIMYNLGMHPILKR